MLLAILFTISILAGQTIKFPLSGSLGPTVLDFYIFLLILVGLYKLKFKLNKPPIFLISGYIFAAVATLSLIFTPLHLAIPEYTISFAYNLRFAMYLTAAWVLYSGAFEPLKKLLPKAMLISGLGLVLLGLLQFIFLQDLKFLQQWGWDPHYFRTVSTFLDPNFAGAFFVLTLILLLHLRCVRIPPLGWVRLTPWVFYVISTIVYFALLTTFSRSSYLMFLVSGSTMSFLKRSKILFFATIFLFLGLMLGFQIYAQVIAQPRNIDRAKSASSRLNTWQQGLYLFQKFPILGVGFNAYRYGVKEYNLGDEQFLKSHGSSSNDSSLLFVASTTGIIGLSAYMYFFLSLIRSNYSNNRTIMLPALLGLLTHSFFANSLFYPPILAWVLCYGLSNTAKISVK